MQHLMQISDRSFSSIANFYLFSSPGGLANKIWYSWQCGFITPGGRWNKRPKHSLLVLMHKLFLLVRCLLRVWDCSISPPSQFDHFVSSSHITAAETKFNVWGESLPVPSTHGLGLPPRESLVNIPKAETKNTSS